MRRALQSYVLIVGVCIGSLASAESNPAPSEARLTAAPLTANPSVGEAASADSRVYSDTFLPLRDDVRAYERDPVNRYTYCIRNVGTYECLSYGSDGNVRRKQHKKTAHGTGVAYAVERDETRLLTNEHVIAWPTVTDASQTVDGVPSGCKLISQKLSIVDNDEDAYDADDIPLVRIVDDRALDAAVVRAKTKLRIIPYRVGRSAALSTNDVVVVRGFPLGVFQAYNTGKIINTRDDDLYKQWDHQDFIIDAQLSSGGSGSPVLALNRTTGEYELVGIFHASYTGANGLNAVIAIDQLRDLMFQLRRSDGHRSTIELNQLPDPQQRQRLLTALRNPDYGPFVALGPLWARFHVVGDAFVIEIFSKDFPLSDQRIALILGALSTESWGKPQQVWFGNRRGYSAYAATALGAESAMTLSQTLRRLYGLAVATLQYRELAPGAGESRQAANLRTRLERGRTRAATQDAELAQQFMDLAEGAAPTSDSAVLPLSEVLAATRHQTSPGGGVQGAASAAVRPR